MARSIKLNTTIKYTPRYTTPVLCDILHDIRNNQDIIRCLNIESRPYFRPLYNTSTTLIYQFISMPKIRYIILCYFITICWMATLIILSGLSGYYQQISIYNQGLLLSLFLKCLLILFIIFTNMMLERLQLYCLPN